MGGRRGFNLVALVLLVVVLTVVGLALATLSQQASRSSHWFHHAQVAHDIADAGLKQAFFMLTRANSAAAAGTAPVGAGELSQAFQALVAGNASSATLQLISSGAPQTLPPALQAQLQPFADFNPRLEVTLRLVESAPLWPDLLNGIPLIPGERKGKVHLVSHCTVKTPAGISIDRSLILEKSFKVVSILPPLLGRFSLFVRPGPGQDANVLRCQFDPTSGDTKLDPGQFPLVLRSKTVAPLVKPGSATLDRAGFVRALTDPRFLDSQGWVYMGPQGGADWKLKLAHGYSEGGESPLLEGTRDPVRYRGNPADDLAFRQRYDGLTKGTWVKPCRTAMETHPNDSLHHFRHGYANNYELIGMDPSLFNQVQTGGTRVRMNLGGGEVSALRLFGTPDALSPTLVFGPVFRSVIRRASVVHTVGPPRYCVFAGVLAIPFYPLEDHKPQARAVVAGAFQGDYDRWGTAREEDVPMVSSLNLLLNSNGNGEYAPMGVLDRLPDAGQSAGFRSDHFGWVAGLPTPAGIPAADLSRMIAGEMDIATLYRGNLANGMNAFLLALQSKLTFGMALDVVRRKVFTPAGVDLPGIVLVKETQPLEVPRITKLINGGVLINRGPINITGNIARGSSTEVLTLVALTGDITVAAGVNNVDALLVAVDGKVRQLGGQLTVNGGMAVKLLDLEAPRKAARPSIVQHDPALDPLGPLRATSLRSYFGGTDRLVVAGGQGE